jgi:hypothetical protein
MILGLLSSNCLQHIIIIAGTVFLLFCIPIITASNEKTRGAIVLTMAGKSVPECKNTKIIYTSFFSSNISSDLCRFAFIMYQCVCGE